MDKPVDIGRDVSLILTPHPGQARTKLKLTMKNMKGMKFLFFMPFMVEHFLAQKIKN
jgi:hypothetical protein